tara:strand:- start:42633 stop:43211 length:579 start_codon:yes stop_codon:yes gene_type:complete
MKIVNQLKVCFVKNIDLKHNDSIGLYYEYERLTKKLPPFQEHDNYKPNSSTHLYTQLPPPYFPMFEDTNPEPKFIFLKKDTIYFNNKIIKSEDLKTFVKPWIENNDAIFSLYDLESTYGKFLEMNAIINSIYEDVREVDSKAKFSKPIKELTREQYDEIKMQIRMQHIWSYPIPHYNHVVQQENTFFGLKVN